MDESIFEPLFCSSLPDIEMTISQYDHQDCEIGRYTGTFTAIFDSIPNFSYYYFRVTALGKKEVHRRVSSEHFGVKATSIGGLKLSEESFINSFLNNNIQKYAKQKEYNKTSLSSFTFAYELIHDFWFADRMKTLKQNTPEGFNAALNNFLRKFKEFQKVENLDALKERNGIYLLVLDEYNSCYLGQSNDLRKRIMRHWSRNDYFTGTGIDMFKAKDTTRIYVAFTEGKHQINSLEHQAINYMPARYALNCLSGGDIDYLAENELSLAKNPCPDSDFVDYVIHDYNIVERINANKGRFIVPANIDNDDISLSKV